MFSRWSIMVVAGAIIGLSATLISQEPERRAIARDGAVSAVAHAHEGSIATARDGTHFKLLGPPLSGGMRRVAWCATGSQDLRSFAFEGEAAFVVSVVSPNDGRYESALAQCARELGR